MRVAALYDIHGNLPALEAVLRDVAACDADEIVVGGDVLPGPLPAETLDCLLAAPIPVRFIRGNGDREVLAYRNGDESGAIPEAFRDVMRWNAAQLSDDQARFVSTWPPTLRITLPGIGDTLFCHATPQSDTALFVRSTPESRLLNTFEGFPDSLVICGHTHMQFDRTIGSTRVVNAGSVGMPFGKPGAYWLLLDGAVDLRHVPYDLESAAARVRATGYPQAEAFALRNILQPQSVEEAEKLFGGG